VNLSGLRILSLVPWREALERQLAGSSVFGLMRGRVRISVDAGARDGVNGRFLKTFY